MIRLDTHLGHAVIFEDNVTEDGWLIWQDRGYFCVWNNGQEFISTDVGGGPPEIKCDAVFTTLDDALQYVKGLT
jgi:hypothetical protein